MNTKFFQYYQKLLASFEARDAGEIDREDEILDELDRLWLGMSAAEKEGSRSIARKAKLAYSLLVSETDTLSHVEVITVPSNSLGLRLNSWLGEASNPTAGGEVRYWTPESRTKADDVVLREISCTAIIGGETHHRSFASPTSLRPHHSPRGRVWEAAGSPTLN